MNYEKKRSLLSSLFMLFVTFSIILHCSEDIQDISAGEDALHSDTADPRDIYTDTSPDTGIQEVEEVKAYFRIPEDKKAQNIYFFPFPSDLLINSDGTL
ncbi:MAG: hypothetical protein N3B13_06325, partial [Deltaproteobacteria bacterium]|nr:hypothetical protein [Deltaproteobacteria bacterium]